MSEIDDLFDAMRTSSIFNSAYYFIRADQDGDKPARVFVTYKVINEFVESAWSNIREASYSAPNNTEIKTKQKSNPVISITIVGNTPNDYDEMRTVAKKIFQYFRETEFTDYSVLVISPNVEDRTTFLDAEYEYKLGFDIRLDYCEETSQIFEEVQTIESEYTARDPGENDVVTDEPLILTKP